LSNLAGSLANFVLIVTRFAVQTESAVGSSDSIIESSLFTRVDLGTVQRDVVTKRGDGTFSSTFNSTEETIFTLLAFASACSTELGISTLIALEDTSAFLIDIVTSRNGFTDIRTFNFGVSSVGTGNTFASASRSLLVVVGSLGALVNSGLIIRDIVAYRGNDASSRAFFVVIKANRARLARF
jgi:hypothetical protein